MEKLNVAIADDNERMVNLLETLIKMTMNWNWWDRPQTARIFVTLLRRRSRMWCFWTLSCRRLTVSLLWRK